MDKSSLGQTMAVVGFHRKYMKHVFTSDELEQYQKFKTESRKKDNLKEHKDPLKQLEDYRVAKEGLEELKPYGIDKKEAIKVMSFYGDKELEKTKQSRKQLNRLIEAQINLEMLNQKRQRADDRSKARSNALPCEPTTSETEEVENPLTQEQKEK